MEEKVNLRAALAGFDEPFSPRIVGRLNDYKLQVAKTKGEFVWHAHPDTDDFFLVVSGELTIQFRDRDIVLGPGELYVVPRRRALPALRRGRGDPPDRAGRHGQHRRCSSRGAHQTGRGML